MASSKSLATEHALDQLYTRGVKIGVGFITTTGMLSLVAVLFATVAVLPRTKAYRHTYTQGYFFSLLFSNILQSIGTVMNIRWINLGGVFGDDFCTLQGAIKQAGNVGNALWTVTIAIHLFNILFLRWGASKLGFVATIVLGWFAIGFIVIIGPTVIQKPELGPYFGPSGPWCWITDGYHQEQTFLEYFFEYLAVGISFVLYTVMLLRVRGNLTVIDGKFILRWVPREEVWQLALGRDFIDTSMLRVVKQMIWYPVAYSVILIPIGISRLSKFAGANVPTWAIVTTAVIFNLTGLVNVILLLTTLRLYPETPLPEFSVPRQQLTKSVAARGGVAPFMLSQGDVPPVPERVHRSGSRAEAANRLEGRSSPNMSEVHDGHRRLGSVSSDRTVDSLTPLRHPGILA